MGKNLLELLTRLHASAALKSKFPHVHEAGAPLPTDLY